jgi:hypothetical protein
VTNSPDSSPQTPDGTEALQDGWVNASKAPRKSALSASPRVPDSKPESETWNKVQDGWDKNK